MIFPVTLMSRATRRLRDASRLPVIRRETRKGLYPAGWTLDVQSLQAQVLQARIRLLNLTGRAFTRWRQAPPLPAWLTFLSQPSRRPPRLLSRLLSGDARVRSALQESENARMSQSEFLRHTAHIASRLRKFAHHARKILRPAMWPNTRLVMRRLRRARSRLRSFWVKDGPFFSRSDLDGRGLRVDDGKTARRLRYGRLVRQYVQLRMALFQSLFAKPVPLPRIQYQWATPYFCNVRDVARGDWFQYVSFNVDRWRPLRFQSLAMSSRRLYALWATHLDTRRAMSQMPRRDDQAH